MGASPDQDVTLLFDHYKVYTTVLVLSHERMRDEVQEDIREQTACLWDDKGSPRPSECVPWKG